MEPPVSLIRLQNVRKHYGSEQVIDDLSLSVEAGEVIGVQGPSGSGKTTMLRLIAGLEKPDAGTVNCESDKLACVFQEPRLLPWKTALENVALPLRAIGQAKARARSHARDWLDKMGLIHAADRYPRQLSGGMAQRVGLARALALEPEVLLLDEPFSALDAERRSSVRRTLENMLAERTYTVFYITHYPYEIEGLATRRLLFTGKGQVEILAP